MKRSIQSMLLVLGALWAMQGQASAQFGIGGTGATGGTGGFGLGTGGTGIGGTGGFGGTGQTGFGATTQSGTSSSPTSPFGGNGTPSNIFGGFNKTPQGFSVPLGTNTGAAGGFGQTGMGGIGGANQLGRTGINGLGMGGLGGIGGLGGLNRGGLGGLNNRNNMNRNNQRGGGQGNNANNKTVRAVVSVGFDRPELPSTGPGSTSEAIQSHFTRMSVPARLKNVQVEMQGRTAILRGQVTNESEKRLAEKLLALEPGVDSVQNELSTLTNPPEEIQPSQSR